MGSLVQGPRLILGLRANLRQFLLAVLTTSFIGAMLGSERSVIADIAKNDFGIAQATVAGAFIVTFGVVKSLANLFAGALADRLGRQRVLVLGWLVAVPVPLLIMFAPNWWWIVGANTLLGLSQGLAWSAVIVMKMDMVQTRQRGMAVGINEFTGYSSIALAALLAGWLASVFGSRPAPFLLPTALAVLGLLLALFALRETRGHAEYEATLRNESPEDAPSYRLIFATSSWRQPSLRSAAQAGLVTKMNDALVWGLIPLMLDDHGLDQAQIAIVAATYPATWGIFQLGMGTLSDQVGRKKLIACGMGVQALGVMLFLTLEGFRPWALAAGVLGLGAAMVYPALLAVVSDVAQTQWRASSVGVYRFWRDSGFAWGALFTGLLADGFGFGWAIGLMALASLGSSLYVVRHMAETLKADRLGTAEPWRNDAAAFGSGQAGRQRAGDGSVRPTRR